ncbi:MAG: universal stress protein [Ardenticatenaceae bacterium]|nr:universal stress protein [Ardenticatenaceae bacterium]
MLNKILLPLDGSTLADCVLPHTAAIAQATGAEVHFLHVLEAESDQPTNLLDWQLRKVEAQTHLQEVEADWQQHGLESDTILLEGKAADRIIEYAQQAGFDLVVVSSHGQSGLTGWNISSVGQKIIHRVHKSILLVRAYQEEGLEEIGEVAYKRILVPLDGSHRAEAILPIACQLAQFHGAALLVVHVVTQPEMMQRTPLSTEDSELIEELMTRNKEKVRRYFEELNGRLPCKAAMDVIQNNDVANALHDLVKREAVDLVILNAHGSSGETQRPYGSTVTNFIDYGATNLLIFQDLLPTQIEPTEAEVAVQEVKKGTRPLNLP